MNNNYVITHLHTMLSNGTTNIDSITDYHDYIDRAKELGMKAICFTEHGNIYSWLNKKKAVEAAGMKYIHGVEAYVTEELYLSVDGEMKQVRDNYHCVLIAKNYDGFLELNKLVSKAFDRDDGHFYFTPRITFDELINTSDNIIITTACLAGILNRGNSSIRERFICFLSRNKHRCFLEIQHHNVTDQIEYNRYLYELHNEIDVPLIVGTDTHTLDDRHLDGRALLQKAKDIRFDNEDAWDLRFKSYDELVESYINQDSLPMNVVFEAIDSTNILADSIEEYTIDTEYKYPHLWEDSLGLFRKKINDGIIWRGVDKYPNYQDYLDRIDYETEAYIHNGAIDFMLLMEDIINWCNKNDIKVGYGRGSVNGSVIAWLLGITEMDSIKHNLNFERFMNTERVSLSDIDTDFPPSRIEDVKQYIYNRHGLYCCDIITFNTIAEKGSIDDVCRGMYKGTKIDYLKRADEIKDLADTNINLAREKYKKEFEYVDMIKGTVVSVGTHPCGLVVSPFPIDDRFGTCTTKTCPYPVSQIYMKEIDSLNYVKLDLLKLDTIELINKTCELAGIERLTPDNVDIDDDNVWNAIREDTTFIFQWDGSTGSDYIKKLLSDKNIKSFQRISPNVDRMTLLSIGNSAIRPAGASYRDDLANGVIRETGSKPIDDFLSNTFGYLVFQCQIIEFLHKYCGFTMGEADIVRRGFAKKTGTDQYIPIIKDGGYLSDSSTHYIDGFIKTMKETYGINEEKSEEDIIAFIKVIEDASVYLFSLNHSQPYSYEGYVCGYLRTYYPLEFLTVAMNINSDNEDKTKVLTNYGKKIGVKFEQPKFRHSKEDYFLDRENKTIYKGVASIKNLNAKVSRELYDLRDNKYTDFLALLKDIDKNTSCNSKQLDILIKLNYFSEFGEIGRLLKIVELYDEFATKKYINKKSLEKFGISEDIVRGICTKETATRFTCNIDSFLRVMVRVVKYNKYPIANTVKDMLEYYGYVDYIIPDASIRVGAVVAVNSKYTPKVQVYSFRTGQTAELKIHKTKRGKEKIDTAWNDLPLEVGDIIEMTQTKRKLGVKYIDGKWTEVPGTCVYWINKYRKIDI